LPKSETLIVLHIVEQVANAHGLVAAQPFSFQVKNLRVLCIYRDPRGLRRTTIFAGIYDNAPGLSIEVVDYADGGFRPGISRDIELELKRSLRSERVKVRGGVNFDPT
jgi:hypothetical protein